MGYDEDHTVKLSDRNSGIIKGISVYLVLINFLREEMQCRSGYRQSVS